MKKDELGLTDEFFLRLDPTPYERKIEGFENKKKALLKKKLASEVEGLGLETEEYLKEIATVDEDIVRVQHEMQDAIDNNPDYPLYLSITEVKEKFPSMVIVGKVADDVAFWINEKKMKLGNFLLHTEPKNED